MKSLGNILKFHLPETDTLPDWTAESQSVGQLPEWRVVECAVCNGTGFVVNGGFDATGTHYSEQPAPCPNPECPVVKRNQAARYERLVSKAPLPAEYAALTFDQWHSLATHSRDFMAGKWDGYAAALAFCATADGGHWFSIDSARQAVGISKPAPNDYVKNSLVLSGQPGVGKTSLAACIVNHLRGRQIPALYMRVSNVLDALREPMNDDKDYLYEFGKTEQQILATFSRAPVLVLDEFNLARASDYSKQRLEDIVRHRMANQLPTVMTTNLKDHDEFNDHWGYRVGHAVQGMSHWIIMRGLELRRRGGPVESL